MKKHAFALFVLAILFTTTACGAEGSVRYGEPFLVDVPPGVELSLKNEHATGKNQFADDFSVRSLNRTPKEMLAVLQIARQFEEHCFVGSFGGSGFFGERQMVVTLPDGSFKQGQEAGREIEDNQTGLVSVQANRIRCPEGFRIKRRL